MRSINVTTWRRWHDWALYGLLVLSVVLNALLSIELRGARASLQPKPFLTGRVAPPIQLRSDRDRAETLVPGEGTLPTLFYWFSTTCSWCEVNLPNLRALSEQAGKKYRLVPVSSASPSELAAYAATNNLGFPLHTISSESARLYRFGGTPETLLVSRKGEFVMRWTGSYAPSMLDHIETTLNIRLPGLKRSGP